MALVLSGERPSAAAPSLNPVRSFGRWLARLNGARRERRALASLYELEPHLLYDLGIDRHDLFEASQAARLSSKTATRALAERRARR